MKIKNERLRSGFYVIVLCLVMLLALPAAFPMTASAADSYTITLHANNGMEETKAVTAGSLASTANIFTYGKCEIESWNTQPDGSGTSYGVGDTINEDITLYAQWVLPLNELDAFDETDNFGYAWTGNSTSPYTFTMKDGTTLHARVVFPNHSDAEITIEVNGACAITGKVSFQSDDAYGHSTVLTICGEGSLEFLEMEKSGAGDTLIVEADTKIKNRLDIGSSGGANSKVVIKNATLNLEDELVLLQYLEMTNAVMNIGKTATFVPLNYDPDNSAYPDQNILLDEYSEINIRGSGKSACTVCELCVACEACAHDECIECDKPTVTMSPTNGGYIRSYYDAVLGDFVEGKHPRDAFDRLYEENYLPVGYKFTGDESSYYLLDGEGKPVTGPVKIRKRFTLTYDANGGTGSMTGESDLYAGDTYPLPENEFTAPTDKVFAGWEVGDQTYEAGNEITITGDTTVTAEWKLISPSYTVTIPATAMPGEAFTVSAEATVLRSTQTLTVAITGTSGTDNAFTLKSAQNVELGYTLKNGETVIALNDKLLKLTNGQTGSVSIDIVPDQAKYSGDYTGTVIFTIALEEVQSE